MTDYSNRKDYHGMTNVELAEELKEYSRIRNGDIAELTYEASVRIAVLDAGLKKLETGGVNENKTKVNV